MAANNIYLQVTFNSQAAQANVNALNQAIAQTGPTAQKSSQQATGALQQVNVSVQQTSRAFGELTTALAGLGIARLVSSIVQVGSEINRAQLSIEMFTGSAEEAAKIIEQIRAIAAQSPFHFKELEETARRLAGFGVAAKDIPTYLKIITDQVAEMGGSIEGVNSIVSIFGRVMNKEFIGAMDLLRLLPQRAVPIMDALKKAMGATSAEEVVKGLKAGVLDPSKTLVVILQAMQDKTGGASKAFQDFALIIKNLGDAFEIAYGKLTSDKGFGKQLRQLGEDIKAALVPVAAFFDWLMKLDDNTKQWIVDLGALVLVVIAFGGAWKLFASIGGPVITVIYNIAKALLLNLVPAIEAVTVALEENPIILWVTGITAALAGLMALAFPEMFKKITQAALGWVGDLWKGMKDKIAALAKESGLFPDPSKSKPEGLPEVGDITQETEENLKKVQTLVREWSDSAGKTMLGALSSPAEAVTIKYHDLFLKLKEQTDSLKITEPHAAELRGQLKTAGTMELEGKLFEKQKQDITERGKLEAEKTKGSYDAQIAYIESLDEQGLRKRVAAIDRITELRIQSSAKVAQVEDYNLQQIYQAQVNLLESYRTVFEAAGVDVDKAIRDRNAEMVAKQDLINQKAVDEQQKYRLEGWKKANDLIIEDQKRVFEGFKSMFDEIFDAFTSKTKSIGQALGDVFKKLALGEARNLFSSQLAGTATELAGYGRPEPGIMRGGGLLSQLFQRGTPPRPRTGGMPELYQPNLSQSGVKEFSGVLGDVTASSKDSANRFAIATGTYDDSTVRFALAVDKFSDATVQSKGSANRSADAADSFSDAFTRASAVTSVPESMLRAVAQVESSMQPGAIGPQTRYGRALGLMQLMPGTARQMGVTQPFNAQQSIMGGGQYLRTLLDKYSGDIPSALAAYNMGPAAFDKAMASGRALPAETRAYVKQVQALMLHTALSEGTPLAQATRAFQLPAGFSMAGGQLAYTPGAAAGAGELPMPPDVFGGGGGGALTMGPTVAELQNLPQRSSIPQSLAAMLLPSLVKQAAPGKGLPSLGNLGELFGVVPGVTSAGTIATSRAAAALYGIAGMALLSKGLQQRNAPATTAGGGLAGLGYVLSNPELLARMSEQTGGVGLGLGAGVAAGAGLGLFASGFQRGGGTGLAMDIGGGALAGAGIGTMILPGVGTAIGAAIGAAAGAITGVVRLFVKTEQERIRATIKQVYGIDISNRQILTQIQQIVDQKYGGSVSIGVRSQEVQDLVRLYALSTGQAANLPRPMYAATIAQSTQGLQTQAVYQGGVKVANPYTGPTTYQYQSAVVGAQGLMPGTSLGVPGASGIINEQWQQLTLDTIRANPAAVANANAAAATAGDSRLSTTAAMQEPLTLLS